MMGENMLRCEKCNSYGLSANCPCGGKRVFPFPPKYSPDDRYAKYRRQAKEEAKADANIDTALKQD